MAAKTEQHICGEIDRMANHWDSFRIWRSETTPTWTLEVFAPRQVGTFSLTSSIVFCPFCGANLYSEKAGR